MGEFRKFTVKNLFDLALENISNDTDLSIETLKNSIFIEAGSTNVTSDYDITISGPYCSQVIKHMFEIYYNQFQTVLPVGFDSNLYPGTASLPLLMDYIQILQQRVLLQKGFYMHLLILAGNMVKDYVIAYYYKSK